MISIIICTRQKNIPSELKENINNTIGLDYELVIIDNSLNSYSIFEAYNEGVCRANYPFLCFMHDDILFHIQDWGLKLVSHFSDETIGLIGVSGTHFMPSCPLYWNLTCMNSGIYIQDTLKNGKVELELIENRKYLKEEKSIEVVTVDGIWFAIPKRLFELIHFDEERFSGFHGYDMDICFQVRSNDFKVIIVSDILIEHKNFSEIAAYNMWIESMKIVNDKWASKLPQFAGVLMSNEEIEVRESHLENYFDMLVRYNNAMMEVNRIVNSKAYKLGKSMLMPFYFLRKIKILWLKIFDILKISNAKLF